MKLTLVIVLAAALAGGIVGAAIGLAIDDDSGASSTAATQAAASISMSRTSLTPVANGHALRAWLGVQVETIDPSVAKFVGGLPARGVIVARVVKGSAAAKAGLKAATRQETVNGAIVLLGGDAIVGVDGRSISTARQLSSAVALRKPGDRLTLGVVRTGKSRTVAATLGNVPAQP